MDTRISAGSYIATSSPPTSCSTRRIRSILTDFGISKASESASQLTHTGTIVGTPYYMSPEQAMGLPVDGRADQYSLAVVAYQLLTGELLFTGESAHTILFKHIYDEAPRITLKRHDVPAHIDAALAKSLSKAAAERFATMEDLLTVLNGTASPRLLSSVGRSAATHSAATASTSPPTRRTAALSRDTTEPITGKARRTSDASAIYGTRRPLKIALLGGLSVLAVSAAAAMSMRRNSGETAVPDVVAAPQATADSSSLLGVASSENANPVAPLPTTQPDTTSIAGDSAAGTAEIERPIPTPAKPKPANRKRAVPVLRTVEDEVRQVAMLTVQADPWGTVYVDGVEIGPSPIVDHALVVGRKYEIRVEHEGFKTRRELITVSGPNAIRRRYILEPGGPE
ncbi:MAG: PEGA domain-containing protein [Gemmatimonadaceae bacterium]